MALKVLYNGGWRDSLSTLREEDFTRNNTADLTTWSNSTLDASSTPRGVLGGHLAIVTGSNEVGAISDGVVSTNTDTVTDVKQIKGIFILDVASSPFENQPALGSGKVAVLSGRSVVEVDIYETNAEDDNADLGAYTAGTPLYASTRGLLTKAATTADGAAIAVSVGVVRTDPADNNGKLVAELFL